MLFFPYIKLSSGTIDSIECLYIDDIEISYQNTCERPINLNITNVSANSATIGFTSQDNETQWEIQYKSSFDSSWSNATTISNITTNPYTLTGLVNSTAYDLRIRAICSPTEQSDWTTTRFHTSISTFPYFNSFDNYGTGTRIMPYGWTKNR